MSEWFATVGNADSSDRRSIGLFERMLRSHGKIWQIYANNLGSPQFSELSVQLVKVSGNVVQNGRFTIDGCYMTAAPWQAKG